MCANTSMYLPACMILCTLFYTHMVPKMKDKLLKQGDLLVLRDETKRGVWLSPSEIRDVVNSVGEVAYTLYSLYRTMPFRESEEITDSNVAMLIGWPDRKVSKYRKVLEASQLIHKVRYGTKQDGVTKFFVGELPVALFNAGLPADVVSPKALRKIMQLMKIESTAELIPKVQDVVAMYEANPDAFKTQK